MPTFAFSATVSGLDLDDLELLDQLYTDAFVLVPSEIDGVVSLDVEIDAPTGEDALKTFTAHLAGLRQIKIERIDEDLVNVAEIALRLGVTPQSVRNYAAGRREATSGFPSHRVALSGGLKLWTWASVHAWASTLRKLPEGTPTPLDSTCVDWYNGSRAAAVDPHAIETITKLRVRSSNLAALAQMRFVTAGGQDIRLEAAVRATRSPRYPARNGGSWDVTSDGAVDLAGLKRVS